MTGISKLGGQDAPVIDDFETWLGERNRWLQTAAKNLIESKKPPTDDEISELARLCIIELNKGTDSGFGKVTPGSLAIAAARPPIRIEQISDVHGLNAVKSGAELSFGGGNIAVFYGQNGSGKSGFARLLKQACGSRSKDEIHPNVFAEEVVACRAKFHLSVGGKTGVIDWTIYDGAHPKLRHAQIFDSRAATVYMGKTEASYEPSQMKFVAALIAISDRVSQKLTNSKNTLVSSLPLFPSDLGFSDEKRWLDALKPATTIAIIEKTCQFTSENDAERIALEGALAQKDIHARVAAIKKEKQAVNNVLSAMSTFKDKLSDVAVQFLVEAHAQAKLKRQAALDSAQVLFANAPLAGVGEPIWQELWKQARLYSQSHAYPNESFPFVSTQAKCVLCQQSLSEEASKRLTHFEKFVTDGLELAAKDAEELLRTLIRALPLSPKEHDWLAHMSVLKVDQHTALKWHKALVKRRSDMEILDRPELVGPFDWSNIDKALDDHLLGLEVEEKALSELFQDGKRQEMENRLQKLNGVKWLSQNKASILVERERLVMVDQYGKAARLAATNALTSKNNELAKSELDAGYQTRFAAELKLLGGSRLPVAPLSKTIGKGRTTFGLTLVGARGNRPPEQILSEGETRIVALAAFLADTTGSNQVAPFIFDDPISSLDQDFEERVVARLVDLAQLRQVIIFTHRLSLVALLDAAIKKVSDNPNISDVVQHVQTLRRLDKTSGILAGQSARDSKPKNAINKLLGETLPKLKKYQDEGDANNYDLMVKSVCSDFRIVVERAVEMVLINGVVLRFRRDIMTKGLLRKLAHITHEDCDLIDDLMGRYSVYEHSQADELPSVPPELAELEADMRSLSAWMKQYQERVA